MCLIGVSIPCVTDLSIGPHHVGSLLLDSLRFMETCGVDHVQLNLQPMAKLLPRCDRRIWADLAVACVATGVRPWSVHLLPLEQLDSDAPLSFRRKLAFGIAEALGVRNVVTHLGGPVYWGPRSLAYDLQSVKVLAEAARKKDMTVMVENTPSCSVSYILEVIRQTDAPNVMLQFDVGHYILKQDDPLPEFLNRASALIGNIEIHDNDGVNDTHAAPGKGQVPWKTLFDTLREISYTGPLILEIGPQASAPDGCERAKKDISGGIEFLKENSVASHMAVG